MNCKSLSALCRDMSVEDDAEVADEEFAAITHTQNHFVKAEKRDFFVWDTPKPTRFFA